MHGRRLASVGKVSDQFESDDSTDSRAGSAQAADRSHGVAVVEVRGQYVGYGGKRSVGKRGQREKQRDQIQVPCEDGGNEQQNADTSKHNQGLSRGAERPAAPNQVARNAAAEEIA